MDFARANAVSEASRVASCLRLAASGVRVRALFNGAIVHPSVSDENGGHEEQEGKKEEGKATFNELLDILRKNPNWFTQEEMQKINMNAQFFK